MKEIPFPTRASDIEFEALVSHARAEQWEAEGVAELARHLAQSGEQLAWPQAMVADVASTGGPGSISTLLAPLALRAHDALVVKLAVVGRPAGAIDALGTLPSYRVRSSTEEVRESVRRCGYAHFLADERFAPLDAALFDYRKRNGALAIPSLAAASLLAKKIAVGVRIVGLDVRVGRHGNFGASVDDASRNARLFCRAGAILGLNATAFISTDPAPVQPWLGRGESLLALALATALVKPASTDPWLTTHIESCCRMAAFTLGAEHDAQLLPAQLRSALATHLAAHGASAEQLCARAIEIADAPRTTIHAEEDGYAVFDLGGIRDALVRTQSREGVAYADPAGLQFIARQGEAVALGQPLAKVRCDDPTLLEALLAELRRSIRTQPAHPEVGPASRTLNTMEIVRA